MPATDAFHAGRRFARHYDACICRACLEAWFRYTDEKAERFRAGYRATAPQRRMRDARFAERLNKTGRRDDVRPHPHRS